MKKYFIIIIVLILSLLSCSNVMDSDSNLIKIPLDNKNPWEKYFPSTVGSFWKYKVYNVDDYLIDTLIVSVESLGETQTVSELRLWRYEYKNNPEKNFVKYSSLTNDIVYEYDSPDLSNAIVSYRFPLEIGNKWDMGYRDDINDTLFIEVIARATMEVGEFIFDNIFQIFVPYKQTDTYVTLDIRYFKPEIGVVYMHHARFSAKEEKQELFEYNIK